MFYGNWDFDKAQHTQGNADEEEGMGPWGYVLLAAGAYARLREGRLSYRTRLCCRRALLFFDSALARIECTEGDSSSLQDCGTAGAADAGHVQRHVVITTWA